VSGGVVSGGAVSGGVVSGGVVSGGVVSGGGLFPMAVAVAVAAAAALVTAVEGTPTQGSRRAVVGTPSSAHSQGSSRADRTGCRSSRSSRLTLAAKGA
jgi:hypothetical protein